MTNYVPRCVRTATIRFGLVVVPVKLYTSTETADEISFNMLHDKDKARLKQQYICTACNEVVDKDHTIRGYEHAKGQYVTFTQAELDALDAVATNEINVHEFVWAGSVDPVYFEKTYFLGPDKGSEKAFELLSAALVETDRVAIAMYARGGEERLTMIRPFQSVLAIHELRFATEVKDPAGIGVEAETTAPLLKLAKQLILGMASEEFVPERYTDTVQARRRQLIDAKIVGGEITVAPTSPPAATVDMIDALKASLAAAKKAKTVTATKRDRKARAASVAKKRKAG